MLIYYLIVINLYIIASNARTNESRCNTLYYGQMDKIMMTTQSQRTKILMEDFYKRRSKQSGMSVEAIKNCYNNKIKKPTNKKKDKI